MPPEVCIVMAIFRPNPAYLSQQIESIAGQTHKNLTVIFVIADCASQSLAEGFAQAAGLRFFSVCPDQEVNAVRAFEMGLAKALSVGGPDALFALCDQDDIWHRDKVSESIAKLQANGADLVHSDARLIDKDNNLLNKSMFSFEKRHRSVNLRSLLYQNSITGMTCLMRRRVVEMALPFPQQSGLHYYHDLWLGLIAASLNGVHLIDKALVDYRQHGANSIGAVNRIGESIFARPSMALLRREAGAYALSRYLAQSLIHRFEEFSSSHPISDQVNLRRALLPYTKRLRGAEVFLGDAIKFLFSGNAAFALKAAGFAVVSIGRVTWALREALGPGLTNATIAFDKRLFSLSPGALPIPSALAAPIKTNPTSYTSIIDVRKRAKWKPKFSSNNPAIVVLVPTLNPTESFAGIATALDIGIGLAVGGHHVRFVATDLPISSRMASEQFLLQRIPSESQSDGAAERIAVHCGVTAGTIPSHKKDIFLATAWWTAHLAHDLIERFGYTNTKFIYLIQDFEPNFYPWGGEFSDAMASYDFDFLPVFNSSTLSKYFESLGFDFASHESLIFHPAIKIDAYAKMTRPNDARIKRLAIYGRPEVARNMYPIAIEAVSLFIERENLGPDDIEAVSIGLKHSPVALPNGITLASLGKLPWEDYPAYLSNVDVGLSLMYSPHPSHPPIEMAAAGVRVVTNSFATKNLSSLSPAILSSKATAEEISLALQEAWHQPHVSKEDRNIDLLELGMPLKDLAGKLSRELHPYFGRPKNYLKRQILVHIGAPKCGSTYLQRVLQNNRETLLKEGVYYPPHQEKHPGNAIEILSISDQEFANYFDDTDVVVLSHENLFSNVRFAKRLAKLAKENRATIHLVVFMRPFNEIIFGDYSQFMKQNFETYLKNRQAFDGKTIEEFAKDRSQFLLPVEFLNAWTKNLPDAQLTIAPHHKIRETMEKLMGVSGIDWELPSEVSNPSLRTEDCNRIVAALQDSSQPDSAIREMFIQAFKQTHLPDTGRTQERRRWIEELFTGQNRALLKNFGYDNSATL
jgi:glycosyltransferase involved in cell wall biosynthesis